MRQTDVVEESDSPPSVSVLLGERPRFENSSSDQASYTTPCQQVEHMTSREEGHRELVHLDTLGTGRDHED